MNTGPRREKSNSFNILPSDDDFLRLIVPILDDEQNEEEEEDLDQDVDDDEEDEKDDFDEAEDE